MAARAGNGHPVQPGSLVTIRYSGRRQRVVRLRPHDDMTALPEVDIPAGSPIASALLGRRAGDEVHVELGAGVEPLVFVILRVD